MKSFFKTQVHVGGGFDAVKFKAYASMASERLKIILSKKQNLVKSSRRSIATLLAGGNYDSARVSVEGCMREENNIRGYEMLTLLLGLLTNRLQLLADSKPVKVAGKRDYSSACPPELKEAVTSVLWAGARVGASVPELVALRKQLESKFGKEFVDMAVGNAEFAVNEQLVERLSMYTPANDACIDYLRSIAAEYKLDHFDEQRLRDPHGALAGAGTTTGMDGLTLTPAAAAAGATTAALPEPSIVAMHDLAGGGGGGGGGADGQSVAVINGMVHTPSGLVIPATTRARDAIDQRLLALMLA